MEKTFRDILRDFLEENQPDSPPMTAPSPSPEFHFQWHPDTVTTPERQARAKYNVAPKSRSTRQVKAPTKETPEVLFPLEKLPMDLQIARDQLIRLGGEDLKSGLSVVRLKRVHRRLAKRFHPDQSGPEASSAQFLLTQECYKKLANFLNSHYSCKSE